MTKLREKSEFNIHAAELLIEKTFYAPSIHCSYYSCFQLLKYTINTFFGIDYVTLSYDISQSEKSTHHYVIDFIANQLIALAGRTDSRNFKAQIKDLKHYREESDYDNVEVNVDKGKTALTLAHDIRNYLKTNFKV